MPAEPPIVIENRKTLTYLLCEAAELEHGLMCEYLYAAFSLKTAADDTLPAEHVEAVERWRSVVLGVAAQEMLHWALVNNLLTAVGSAPYVARPHMPHQAKGYPAGVQLALVPFGERALRHFLFLERPEGMELRDADGFDPAGPALPIMAANDIVPWGQEFHTVGHLYRSIQGGIANLAERIGEEQLFIGPVDAQAGPESFGWPQLVPITDVATASRAIEDIVEQGEGARGDWSAAHYGRFLTVLEELLAIKAADPTFEPAHPAVAAGVRPVDGVEPHVVITDPVTAAVSDLFNVNYDLILQILVRYLANVGEDREQLGILTRTAVTLMFAAIKPLGVLLARLPVGPQHPGATAGANFQLFYQRSFLLPHRRATWIRFTERLDEAAAFADGIDADAPVRAVLDDVAKTLHQLAALVGSRIDG
jgi:Ferritin-like